MISPTSLISLILPFLLCTGSVQAALPGSSCVKGFHQIVARATLEPPGEGSTGALAKAIAAKVPMSDSVGLVYPAAVPYNASEQRGVASLRRTIKSYVAMCPDAQIVLLGYSQGADVIADVLGGVGDKATMPIKGKEAEAISGIILFSDLSYVPGQPYDAGTSKKPGKYPRSPASLAKMARFSHIMKSYCDKGDTDCASGSNSTANVQYLTLYEKPAAKFIAGLYKAPS